MPALLAALEAHVTADVAPRWDGERRHLTVMFCDLVGSTAIATAIDPEDMRDVLREFQDRAAAVIEAFGGYVARYQGDGILVYFGFPHAHEDDAQRAVRAALAIVDSMGGNAASAAASGLSVRIGMHSGETLVTEMGAGARREQTDLVGATPSVASRMQQLAGPNEVVISETTAALAEGFFTMRELGPRELKGVPLPVHAFVVAAETSARTRLEAHRRFIRSPFVGREMELAELVNWLQGNPRQGGVAVVSGEPGIGKSRLARVALERAEAPDGESWICACLAYGQHTPFAPLAAPVRSWLAAYGMGPATALEMLLPEHVADGSVAALAAQLGVAPPPTDDAEPSAPDRARIVEAMLALLGRIAQGQRLRILIEDLQWADPSTRHLVERLAATPPAGLRLVVTVRPDVRLPSGHINLRLASMASPFIGAIAAQSSSRPLTPSALDAVVARAGGNPLFAEELARAMTDEPERPGQGEPRASAIPALLHDLLLARLDRVGPARRAAQVAATLGTEFSREFLESFAGEEGVDLGASLPVLVDAGILEERDQDRIGFRHALIRDAAYSSLVRSARRDLHGRVVDLYSRHFPHLVEERPELVAQHADLAGRLPVAVDLWRRAGRNARARLALEEAIVHLTRALEALAKLPESAERDAMELPLVSALVTNLMNARGHDVAAAEPLIARGLELARQPGLERYEMPLILQSNIRLQSLGDYDRAIAQSRRAASLLGSNRNPVEQFIAYNNLGGSLFWNGDVRDGLEALLLAPVAAERATQPDLMQANLALRVLAMWLCASDEAPATEAAAVALFDQLRRPYGAMVGYLTLATAAQLAGDLDRTAAFTARAGALIRDYRFAGWSDWHDALEAWAEHAAGRDEALSRLRTAATGAPGTFSAHRPYLNLLLADRLLSIGRPEDALRVLDQAIAESPRGWRWTLPELYRLRARCLPPGTERDDSLARAEALARKGGATRLLERVLAERGEPVTPGGQ